MNDFSDEILTNVAPVCHSTQFVVVNFSTSTVKPIYLNLWCRIMFPLSHVSPVDLTPTLTNKKDSSIQLSQVEKAPERAWIKYLFSSCFDKSSVDTSLRATTWLLVCPCISDITGHPILSLNY